jgi:hypothetical protein
MDSNVQLDYKRVNPQTFEWYDTELLFDLPFSLYLSPKQWQGIFIYPGSLSLETELH